MTRKVYWLSGVDTTDDFGDPIVDEFIDGRTNLPGGPWAMMTPKSWDENGCGKLGTGYGQRYKMDTTATKSCYKWPKVEG